MRTRISRSVVDAIGEAEAASPYVEICGLLLGSPDRVTGHLPCRNVADDPATAFEVDPGQLLSAHRAARAGGPAVVGCYHSHPGGPPLPSAKDAAAAAPDGRLWLIVAGRGTGVYRAVANGRIEGRFEAVPFDVE